mmetsp:Transcript_33785/g.62536  ORF Transcript_33785/g.62536 Transcript_33785/m.62536 type:complete len:140 (+) Transcript_33785:1709-2128(+)
MYSRPFTTTLAAPDRGGGKQPDGFTRVHERHCRSLAATGTLELPDPDPPPGPRGPSPPASPAGPPPARSIGAPPPPPPPPAMNFGDQLRGKRGGGGGGGGRGGAALALRRGRLSLDARHDLKGKVEGVGRTIYVCEALS